MNMLNIAPADIGKRSFEIITNSLGERAVNKEEEPISKRCIHTSADFEYADNLAFSENSVSFLKAAIKDGAHIVTDTKMAMAGINKNKLSEFGGSVHCFIGDEDVAKIAKKRNVTRSLVSMEKAASLNHDLIFAIGNAPTALISLYELIKKGAINPKGIIAVPVGFVNVVETKELIFSLDIPFIVAKGRKGGSNIAAAICNGLLYNIQF